MKRDYRHLVVGVSLCADTAHLGSVSPNGTRCKFLTKLEDRFLFLLSCNDLEGVPWKSARITFPPFPKPFEKFVMSMLWSGVSGNDTGIELRRLARRMSGFRVFADDGTGTIRESRDVNFSSYAIACRIGSCEMQFP